MNEFIKKYQLWVLFIIFIMIMVIPTIIFFWTYPRTDLTILDSYLALLAALGTIYATITAIILFQDFREQRRFEIKINTAYSYREELQSFQMWMEKIKINPDDPLFDKSYYKKLTKNSKNITDPFNKFIKNENIFIKLFPDIEILRNKLIEDSQITFDTLEMLINLIKNRNSNLKEINNNVKNNSKEINKNLNSNLKEINNDLNHYNEKLQSAINNCEELIEKINNIYFLLKD